MDDSLKISRREFIKKSSAITVCASCIPCLNLDTLALSSSHTEARYYEKLKGNKIQCHLCPWNCVVEPGKKGHCQVRVNRSGTYNTLVYGKISAYHNDPIEKKPFYHVLPSTYAFSIASVGCNVDCLFCQNWELARRSLTDVKTVDFTPDEIVEYAKKVNSTSIAFTYNEPTIFNEFVYDVAEIAQNKGLKTVIVSNGYINRRPLLDLVSKIDAYKVDLKAFTQDYYRNVVHGRLEPIKETLITLKQEGIWSEIVYLIVPTLNDNMDDIKRMCKWIKSELGDDVPVHFSRFYPKYKLRNLPPTPVKTMVKARKTALDAGIKFAYLGNIPGHEGENTYCPSCSKTLIRRVGYRVYENHIKHGKCRYCSENIPGIWD
ncbi:MAG: AmmeMemoRadiSam system radical SAM enzyme [bacterium]